MSNQYGCRCGHTNEAAEATYIDEALLDEKVRAYSLVVDSWRRAGFPEAEIYRRLDRLGTASDHQTNSTVGRVAALLAVIDPPDLPRDIDAS